LLAPSHSYTFDCERAPRHVKLRTWVPVASWQTPGVIRHSSGPEPPLEHLGDVLAITTLLSVLLSFLKQRRPALDVTDSLAFCRPLP